MSEREQSPVELRQRISELETVLEVGREITSTLDVDRIMDLVLDACMGAVNAEAGTLWILEDAHLLPLAVRGPKADRLKGLKLKQGEGLAGQVCENREPVFVEDVTRDERWAKRFDDATGFITRSMLVVPLFTDDISVGSLQMINKLDGSLFNESDLRISTDLAAVSAKIIVNSRIHTQQCLLLDTTVRMLASVLDARDPYTRGHSERVSKHALLIAGELGLSPEEQGVIERAALLHDIGKIAIPEEVLLDANPLDAKAWEQINKHPSLGANILFQLEPKTLIRQLWAGTLYHHERYDGNGYPVGLAGEDIPLVARIIAVANAFDNLVSQQRFGPSKGIEEALEEIELCAGTYFDPKVVEVFVNSTRARRTGVAR
ncbi:MAG: HD domain-containing protein [Clostridia bacterium]|nr:HD domain-containing protein [Clostridia bacterium]MDQ7791730.1 HD domain-containing protein [Clostridia bacterium]